MSLVPGSYYTIPVAELLATQVNKYADPPIFQLQTDAGSSEHMSKHMSQDISKLSDLTSLRDPFAHQRHVSWLPWPMLPLWPLPSARCGDPKKQHESLQQQTSGQ